MKSYLLLILLTCATLQAQSNLIQTSGNQLDYFKSNLDDLKDEIGNKIFQSNVSDSLILIGEESYSYFGFSVSIAGDVNGDGYSDVIVGAKGEYTYRKGNAYIYYGGFPMNTIADVVMTGESIGNMFGRSVSSAGDINGDGYSDVIVGASGFNGNTGRAYIYYGSSSMDNIADVILTGETTENYFGISVSCAGNVNGDGFSDVIVGAWGYNSRTGRAYIYYGSSIMNNVFDVRMTGESSGDFFGWSVSTAGNVNGDGYSDIIVGSRENNAGTGSAYIYFGGSNMNNIFDVKMIGESIGNKFGYSVSTAGDVNGDGFSDIMVGAEYYNSAFGRVYIYFGGISMNNVTDLFMTGEATNNFFGESMAPVGDLNDDGFSDIIIGAFGNEVGGDNAGRVYIYFGDSSMNNVADVIFTGEEYNQIGICVSSSGDLNGDGHLDIIFGAIGDQSNTGRVYLYSNLLPKPDLIYPVNNSINNPLTIIFKWKKYIPASYYIIYLSTDSNFNVTILMDTIYNDTSKIINGLQKGIKYYWKICSIDLLGNTYVSLVSNFTTLYPIYLKIKLLFEGMYSSSFNQLIRKDSLVAYLHNSAPPFIILDSANASIDSLSFSGFFKFFNAQNGSYYISVRHLNSIETWSKAGGEYLANDGTFYNYDFTSSNTQAYWNNLKLKGSKYCLFGGDVNQDGFIDLLDVVPIYNDAINFVTGNFLPADLTGDNIVDLADVTLCYNNSSNFIRLRRP